jgi:hypothetical protein
MKNKILALTLSLVSFALVMYILMIIVTYEWVRLAVLVGAFTNTLLFIIYLIYKIWLSVIANKSQKYEK